MNAFSLESLRWLARCNYTGFARVLHGIRYSIRKFVRTPGLALALLLTIALGVGANVSIYSFARGVVRPAFPLEAFDRVVSIFGQDARVQAGPLSYREYLSVKSHSATFEWVGAARISPDNVVIADQPAIVPVAAVTPNLASALNLSMRDGVIVSHRVWRAEFGAEDVRGEKIRIDGVEARVAGVAPNWLEGLYRDQAVGVWMPLKERILQRADRQSKSFWVFARLRRGVPTSAAEIAVTKNRRVSDGVSVLPYSGMTPEVAAGVSRISELFRFAAVTVFLVACANVILFLIGRASTRSHESSIRVALGAGRRKLVGELLWDSVVISFAGGAGGMLLAIWMHELLPALLFEQDAERLVFAPDLTSIAVISAVCIGITIVCGLLPIVAIRDDRPATVLRRESAGPSRAIRRFRAALVIAEMASCCMLTVCTAFLLNGLYSALKTSSGQRLGDPIIATVQAQPETGIRYLQNVEQTVKQVAGVSGIVWTGLPPGGPPSWRSFRIEPRSLPLRDVSMDLAWFTPDLVERFNVKAGRLFGFFDQTCRVAVVNEKAAAALWGSDTVGRSVLDSAGLPVDIVGVIAEKGNEANGVRPTIYYNYPDQSGSAPARIAFAHFRAPVSAKLASVELDANVVSPGYFEAMGLPLIAGQALSDHRMPGACRIGVVNQEASSLYFDGNPIGAAVIDETGTQTAIIGVVQSKPLGMFQSRAEPAIYFPMWQDSLPRMTLIAGTRHGMGSMLADLRKKIGSVPGRGPAPIVVETLATRLAHTALAPLRIATVVIGVSGATALLLSVLGLLGALSDNARQRRRELAIRVALGAQRRHVIYEVMREGGRLACAGTLIGMFGALALSRLLSRIIPVDSSPALWVWPAAPLVIAIAVMIASVLPARSALVVSPLTIMREEN